MARRDVWYPHGWGPGPYAPVSYSHPDGALVVRVVNPATGMIEWGAVMDPAAYEETLDVGLIDFHGQDLGSATGTAIEWVS